MVILFVKREKIWIRCHQPSLCGVALNMRSNVLGNKAIHISGVEGHIIAPLAKLTQIIDRSDPFSQCLSFLFITAGFLALGFQDQCLTVSQPNQKVRQIFFNHTIEDIQNLKAKVVIFCPCSNILIFFDTAWRSVAVKVYEMSS